MRERYEAELVRMNEQLEQARVEGGVRLLPEPPPERGYADPYGVGAFILRDALASAAALIPELQIDGFAEVAARLDTVRTGPNEAPPHRSNTRRPRSAETNRRLRQSRE
jgi:hypothetical protein